MDKEQIIGAQTKDELDQPKGSQVPSLLLKEISVLDQIFQWMPMGYRVVIDLPLLGDDKSMIFLISAKPYIPHISNDTPMLGLQQAMNVYANRCSVFHDLGSDLTATTPVRIVQHSPPPLLSDISRSNRYWTGALKFRIRAVASFLNQGYIATTPFYGMRRFRFNGNPFTKRQMYIRPDESSYLGNQANSYLMADTSMSRHMEVEVDYRHPTPMIDHLADISSIVDHIPREYADYEVPPQSPFTETFIGVQLRGDLPSNNSTNQMAFELEMCAGENFRLSGETVYIRGLSRKDLENFTDYGSTLSAQPLPVDFLTPDFTTNNATTGKNRWSGNVNTTTTPYYTLRYTKEPA